MNVAHDVQWKKDPCRADLCDEPDTKLAEWRAERLLSLQHKHFALAQWRPQNKKMDVRSSTVVPLHFIHLSVECRAFSVIIWIQNLSDLQSKTAIYPPVANSNQSMAKSKKKKHSLRSATRQWMKQRSVERCIISLKITRTGIRAVVNEKSAASMLMSWWKQTAPVTTYILLSPHLFWTLLFFTSYFIV